MKPAWFAFKKYKKIYIITGLCACIATGLFVSANLNTTRPTDLSSVTSPTTTIHLRAVGDIMLGRSVATHMKKYNDWSWPFSATIPYLPLVDGMIGNLETPIVSNCPLTDSGMIFCAPPESVSGLVQSKFTLLSLANNHTLNYGPEGLNETKYLLSTNDIPSIGNLESLTKTVQSETIGYLALDDISGNLDIDAVASALEQLSKTTNLVVVMIHWGHEYQTTPSNRQQQLAQLFVRHGADIILGSHPHVIQSIVLQQNTLIAYSLGNYVFDQMEQSETRKGLILDIKITFTNHQPTNISYTPISTIIDDYGQPRFDNDQ